MVAFMQFIYLITPLLTLFVVALMGPIILVSKWLSRPTLALLSSLLLYFFILVAIMIITLVETSYSHERLLNSLKNLGLITLIYGLPVLKFIQWRKLRKAKAMSQSIIEATF